MPKMRCSLKQSVHKAKPPKGKYEYLYCELRQPKGFEFDIGFFRVAPKRTVLRYRRPVAKVAS